MRWNWTQAGSLYFTYDLEALDPRIQKRTQRVFVIGRKLNLNASAVAS